MQIRLFSVTESKLGSMTSLGPVPNATLLGVLWTNALYDLY